MSEDGLVPIHNVPETEVDSLHHRVDDLFNTRDPFDFRNKLDSLITDPTSLLKIVLEMSESEKDFYRSERILSIMGWTGEIIGKRDEVSDEERLLLRKSFDHAEDAVRRHEYLDHYMTAAHTLLRFQVNDDYFNQKLKDLGNDVFDELTATSQTEPVVLLDKYKLRGYAQDNDLLENIVDRLDKNGASDEGLLKRLMEIGTEKEGRVRLRTIYKARDMLSKLHG